MKDTPFTEARLLSIYDRVAEAEEAIPRLRRFVLDLAVRGKLVPQDAGDERASVLLEQIAASHHRKAELLTDSRPFALPEGWCWTLFGTLHNLIRGVTYSKSDVNDKPAEGFVPVLRANNISITLTKDEPVYVKKDRVNADQFLRRGDYMIAMSSGSKNLVGKAAFVSEDMDYAFGGFCGVLRILSDSLTGFVGVFLASNLYREAISADSRGIGINNLKKEALSNQPFPLPPLAEQHRIVAKVEELMALLDRLEAARAAREETRTRLTAATLSRLTEADTDTPTAARFALQTLPALTTRPDQIKTLRQTILNLAVRGKLVEQDAGDEPANELLDRARVAKRLLQTQRRIGRTEEIEPCVSVGEICSPQNWSWAYLADFALVQGGKRLPAGANFSADITEFVYIRVTDMKDGTISTSSLKYVSEDVRRQIAKYTIDRNDLYITIAGTIGDVGIVPERFHGHNLTENAAKIVFREIDRLFLKLVLRSKDVQDQFEEKTKQMAQPKLALKRILGARVPVPPLAEQHRIVAKVEELMSLCDRLERALQDATTTRARLLDATLREALAGAQEAA